MDIDRNRENRRGRGQDHPGQFPAYYYWPGPYGHPQQGHPVYIMPGHPAHPHQMVHLPKMKMKRAKSADNDDKDEEEESPVANAEPTEDVNYRNKLFSVSDGYENDETIAKV